MHRRHFLRTTGGCILTLGVATGAPGATSKDTPDPQALGEGKLAPIYSGSDGRIVVSDSTSYLDKRVTITDVIVASSFCGVATISGALAKGIKGIIAHDAGVGKEQAGISGLIYGDRHGIPVAAVAANTATLSNGNSVLVGTISHANETAERLGVRPGQTARDAAQAMLKAPEGRVIPNSIAVDNTLYEMESTANGRVYAVWSLLFLGDRRFPNDVFSLGTHSARVAAEHAFRWGVRGWIANDAGPGKDKSGIWGLDICAEKGMPAAAVAAMSARIGDGLSTYREGVISAANEPAKVKGIVAGMSAQEALRRMLA
jgi:phosphohistidine swiveling domain-containing protein